jgi:hypothetical protein
MVDRVIEDLDRFSAAEVDDTLLSRDRRERTMGREPCPGRSPGGPVSQNGDKAGAQVLYTG